MGCISPHIKEDAKVTILGTVVCEKIAHPLAGDIWKTKRLSATVLRPASGTNCWIISLDANLGIELEVSACRMKFVAVTAANNDLNNQNTNVTEEFVSNKAETDLSSDSEQSDNEINQSENERNISGNGKILWTDSSVTIDSRRVHRSYTNLPIVNLSDIANASPRQFFEHFLLVEYFMSTVIPATNKRARESERLWQDLTWMELMRFIGVLTVMIYVKCADINNYWAVTQEPYSVALEFGQYMSHRRFRNIVKFLTLTDESINNDDPFYFVRKFHTAFNKNLSEAVTPGNSLCIDESMCQWMVRSTKARFSERYQENPTQSAANLKLFLMQKPIYSCN